MAIIKKIFSLFLRVIISIALLVFLFKQVDEKTLLGIIKGVDKPLLLLALIVFSFTYILCLWRWRMLLEGVKIHLPLARVITSFAAGTFFNLFLPSTIGGDVVRSIDLSTHTRKPREILTTVFLDRLSGYVGLVVVALLAVFLGWHLIEDKSVLLSIGIITGLLITILLVLFNKPIYSKINSFLDNPRGIGKIREIIRDLHQELHYFRDQKKLILKNLVLSLLSQIIAPTTFYILALALGIKVNLIYFFIFLPIIGAITLLPISIGGLGLRDATTIYFFAKIGVSRDLSFAMSLLSFFFLLFYASLGGIIYVLTLHHRRIQPHQSSAFCQEP